MESTPDSVFRTDAVKYALVGLMRDLRGIAMATNRLVFTQIVLFKNETRKAVNLTSLFSTFVFLSRRTYGFLFDWLYPAHMPLLLKGISHWTDNPEVLDLVDNFFNTNICIQMVIFI